MSANISLSSVCFVFDQDDRVLLSKRRQDPWRGEWAAPGGKLEKYETFTQCATRELLEETGIYLNSIPTLFCVDEYISAKTGTHVITGICVAHVPNGVAVQLLEPTKHEGWEWFSASNLPESKTPSGRRLKAVYASLVKSYVCERCEAKSPVSQWGPGWIVCPACKFVARSVYEKQQGLRVPER